MFRPESLITRDKKLKAIGGLFKIFHCLAVQLFNVSAKINEVDFFSFFSVVLLYNAVLFVDVSKALESLRNCGCSKSMLH